MIDFIYLIKEEASYHILNVIILIIFSIFGTYITIKKRIKLKLFKIYEEKKENITEDEKNKISKEEKKYYPKEFIKSFIGLFIIYTIYILFRYGVIPFPSL